MMTDSAFEKVFMDTNFKNCQSIFKKLSTLLEHVDIKQVGDIKQINDKLLSLSTDMYKLLCVTESVFVYDQKLKGNGDRNFMFRGIEYLDDVSSTTSAFPNLKKIDFTVTKVKPEGVKRLVECNFQSDIPSDLDQISSQETIVQEDTKSDLELRISKEGAALSDTSDVNPCHIITSKIRSEMHRNILYKGEKYTCNLCSVTLQNLDGVISHVTSKEHKDICKNPSACFDNILKDSCNIGAFWSFVPLYLKICKMYIQPTGFTCTLCKCSIPCNAHGVFLHISGKKHLNSVPPCLQLEK